MVLSIDKFGGAGPSAAAGAEKKLEELRTLSPWDGEPYELTHWRMAKVHPDHHVASQYALYSVPSALCAPGQKVEIGLGSKLVRIYHRGKLVKLHPRQPREDAPRTSPTTHRS